MLARRSRLVKHMKKKAGGGIGRDSHAGVVRGILSITTKTAFP